MIFYKTKSGVIVGQVDTKPGDDGVERVLCKRLDTGGMHGWLRSDRLTLLPYRDAPEAVALTAEEKRAIATLKRLARRWPRTLELFSWSGSLQVLKPGNGRTMAQAKVASIAGIPNGGGDPNEDDIA